MNSAKLGGVSTVGFRVRSGPGPDLQPDTLSST